MKSSKKDKTPLGTQIETELLNYITQLPVEVGQKLPSEYNLAKMFSVCRSTIREAVRSLASKGVLEVRRGDGTYVISSCTVENDPLGLSKMSDKYQLALDLCEVRLLLEPQIAAKAAENATLEDFVLLQKLCNETEQLFLEGKDHIQKDIEFHTCIAQCSKNLVVESLIPIINTAVRTFSDITHRSLVQETLDTHRAILEAIRTKDSIGAKCAMIMHLTYNRQAIIRQMKHPAEYKL